MTTKQRKRIGEATDVRTALQQVASEGVPVTLGCARVVQCRAKEAVLLTQEANPRDVPQALLDELRIVHDNSSFGSTRDDRLLLGMLLRAAAARERDPTFFLDVRLGDDGKMLTVFWCLPEERQALFRHGRHLIFVDTKVRVSFSPFSIIIIIIIIDVFRSHHRHHRKNSFHSIK